MQFVPFAQFHHPFFCRISIIYRRGLEFAHRERRTVRLLVGETYLPLFKELQPAVAQYLVIGLRALPVYRREPRTENSGTSVAAPCKFNELDGGNGFQFGAVCMTIDDPVFL